MSKRKFDEGRAIIYFFFVVVLFAILIIVGSTVHKPYVNVRFFKDDGTLNNYSEGWTLYTDKAEYKLSLPSKNEFEVEGTTVTLVNTLPESLPLNPSVMMRSSLQRLKIFLDDELIYSYGSLRNHTIGRSSASAWNIVPIPESAAGKEIKVVITSPYKSFRSTFNDFYIGSYSAILAFLFNKYFLTLLFIFQTLLIGIGLFIYYAFLRISGARISSQMFYASLTAIFAAAYEFTECKLTQLLIGNMVGFSSASFIFLSIMVIPMMFYVDSVEGRYYHKVLGPIQIALEVNIFVQMIIQLTGLLDFYEMMTATNILIGISALAAIVTIERKYRKHKEPGLHTLLLSVAFLSFGGLLELAFMYMKGYVSGLILNTAVMFLIFVTAAQSLKSASATIQESKRAMEESAAKSSFLANISHEIRTPMNAIFAMSELLSESEDMSVTDKEYAGTIHVAAQNLLDIINDLLDFSKISAKKYVLIPTVYDLNELVNSVKEIIGIKAEEKGLKFDVDINPDIPPTLVGDEGKIRQILINLLNNAVKFTSRGEVGLKVDFTEYKGQSLTLVMSVSDTGIGIRPEDMGDLFEAFVQVDKAKNKSVEGTGLGLAISKALANMMGGDIYVESEYGEGSRFTVTIVQTVKTGVTLSKKDEKPSMFSAPEARVLVVDDNVINLRVMKELLARFDIKPTICSSGAQAVMAAKKKEFDIVFLDQMMPHMDGLECARLIRQIPNVGKKVKIVAFTANAIKGTEKIFADNGFDEYVSKPVSLGDISIVLKKCLDKSLYE